MPDRISFLSRQFATLARCGGLLFALAVAAPAMAEPSAFQQASLQVLDARAYVNEADGISFASNDPLTLTRRIPASGARNDAAPVSVRIFSLAPGQTVPSAWAVFEPCWVYFSSLLPVRVNASGTFNLFTLNMLWLRAVKGGTMQAARYLLVFEQGDGDGQKMFRLNEGDRADYFRHGLLIEVHPEGSFGRAETDKQADAAEASRQQWQEEAKRNTPQRNCYSARLQRNANAQDADLTTLALNESCDPAALAP